MKYAVKILLMFGLLVSSVSVFAESTEDEAYRATKRLDRAVADLDKLTKSGDKGIPQSILSEARCIAIVPKFVKGGFALGAEHGRGVATCSNVGKWSTPAFFTITGGSWGAQIGVERVELVMLFMNEDGARKLLSANWKIGADASAAGGPWGRDASANTSWKLNASILTYSRAKGAFIGLNLNGAHVRPDDKAIRAFYGRDEDFRKLLEGQVTPPAAAQPFLAGITREVHEAKGSKSLLVKSMGGSAAHSDEAESAQRRLDSAVKTLDELANAKDKGIPQSILDNAKCIAIVPNLVKGGFVFGAEHGRGVATCRNNNKWSSPAFFTMTGGNWGAQIGVAGVELVMIFTNDEGARHLLSANWKIGADAGIAAGPVGRQASASTDWKMNTGILTYSRSKGAFIGIDLGGTNVQVDNEAMRAFYGRDVSYRAALEGQVTPPPAAQPFLAGIQREFHEAEAGK